MSTDPFAYSLANTNYSSETLIKQINKATEAVNMALKHQLPDSKDPLMVLPSNSLVSGATLPVSAFIDGKVNISDVSWWPLMSMAFLNTFYSAQTTVDAFQNFTTSMISQTITIPSALNFGIAL